MRVFGASSACVLPDSIVRVAMGLTAFCFAPGAERLVLAMIGVAVGDALLDAWQRRDCLVCHCIVSALVGDLGGGGNGGDEGGGGGDQRKFHFCFDL